MDHSICAKATERPCGPEFRGRPRPGAKDFRIISGSDLVRYLRFLVSSKG